MEAPWFEAGAQGHLPHVAPQALGEGHFAARLRKLEGEEPEAQEQKGQSLPKAWSSFAKEAGILLPREKCVQFGDRLFLLPENAPE